MQSGSQQEAPQLSRKIRALPDSRNIRPMHFAKIRILHHLSLAFRDVLSTLCVFPRRNGIVRTRVALSPGRCFEHDPSGPFSCIGMPGSAMTQARCGAALGAQNLEHGYCDGLGRHIAVPCVLRTTVCSLSDARGRRSRRCSPRAPRCWQQRLEQNAVIAPVGKRDLSIHASDGLAKRMRLSMWCTGRARKNMHASNVVRVLVGSLASSQGAVAIACSANCHAS